MSRILITSGPTRQYLDPVRYITNASSGRMGRALAEAALAARHHVVVVSGPVEIEYPAAAEVIRVVTTEEMLDACRRVFPSCDGAIGVAAPCDYRPEQVAASKIAKTGEPLVLRLVETPDILATLGAEKGHRWLIGFALETDDQHRRALAKLRKKRCDLMVLNGPGAMHSTETQIEILNAAGQIVATCSGSKETAAAKIIESVGSLSGGGVAGSIGDACRG
jgi:phosphopantothenoylcysteine decarboxylase/phosphopantothenate--cysteine ligase